MSSKKNSFLNVVDNVITEGVHKGILHLTNQSDNLNNNNLVKVREKDVINFGSCSYLGLEFNEQIKEEAKMAIDKYGTQFSSSRAYLSPIYYEELENTLYDIFGSKTIVTPTTTLGHIATIPVVVERGDVVIIDQQVHSSVQNAVTLLKPKGIHVEIVRHNRMDLLEEKIKEHQDKANKIWYMADGIYSMYGDCVPTQKVEELLEKYKEFWFYVDDAHGMSWTGKKGRGYVLEKMKMNQKMIVATSFAKAYATGGGAIIFPNPEMARKVRTCGGPLITSGPMQPGALGAAIASGRIHLTDQIYDYQKELEEKITYTNSLLLTHGLPLVANTMTPIFFIGVGLPKIGYNVIDRMMNDGFYLNLGAFPAVPMKNTGVRFTITRLHTKEQIKAMVESLAKHLPIVIEEEGYSLDKIYRDFKMKSPEEKMMELKIQSLINKSNLKVEHCTTIEKVDKNLWDSLFKGNGTYDWDGLKFLETTFTNNELVHDNWKFDYLLVKDIYGQPILATFMTTAISKDDMFAPGSISKQIEVERLTGDPFYLTSKTLMVGSLLTEGNHLYLDKGSDLWKEALNTLFEKLHDLQEQYQANNISIRDLPSDDSEMDEIMLGNGFFRTEMPENNVIPNISWKNEEEYIATLSSRSRKHVRKDVLKNISKVNFEIVESHAYQDVQDWYDLYCNVKNKNLELNTFGLPFCAFTNMANDPNWDVTTISLADTSENNGKAIAVMFCYKNGKTYNPMILGLNYDYLDEVKLYKQVLYHVTLRASKLGMKKINFGFAASTDKKKFGAKQTTVLAYNQVKDHYNMEVIESFNVREMAY